MNWFEVTRYFICISISKSAAEGRISLNHTEILLLMTTSLGMHIIKIACH